VHPSTPSRLGRWLLPLAVLTAIFISTSWPTPPDLPGQSDKLVHGTAYALLAVSVGWAARLRAYRRMVMWLVVLSAIGAIDEWHQQFIPGRRMDRRDWFADSAGAAVGLTLVTALARRREFVA
jgi:VanZ family protein